MEKYELVCQDTDGWIKGFRKKEHFEQLCNGSHCGSWEQIRFTPMQYVKRNSPLLIDTEVYNWKIEGGVLKTNCLKEKKMRHKHADLMIAYANDVSLEFEGLDNNGKWYPCTYPSFYPNLEYRIKPKQVICYNHRMYTTTSHEVKVVKAGDMVDFDFKEWLGDWCEYKKEVQCYE